MTSMMRSKRTKERKSHSAKELQGRPMNMSTFRSNPLRRVPCIQTDFVLEEKAQLSQAYLLTKEKPNFIPRALLSRKKQEEEQALTEAVGRRVEVDMQEEEAEKAALKAAQEKKKLAVIVPRPAFSLDDADDDEFVSGEE